LKKYRRFPVKTRPNQLWAGLLMSKNLISKSVLKDLVRKVLDEVSEHNISNSAHLQY